MLQIIEMIESNQVTIIQGETGSGKTTQVPQYILDHYARQNKYCNIVVTQPRIIAAKSIARRVCFERQWQLGHVCGYQVGDMSVDTRRWLERLVHRILGLSREVQQVAKCCHAPR